MDDAEIARIRADMAYEFSRTAPPEGFPKFHDIAVERHTSEAFYQLEQEHIWAKSWVIAGREDDIAEPGDYFQMKDLGVPLLVVRGTDGEIRCFYNTCQHRGAPVVRDERGSSRRLRCQYHSWTYEIDGGTLVSLPDERDFVDLDWTARCLPKAQCDTFAGFIFINRDRFAPPLMDWLGQATELFAPFSDGNLREIYRESITVPCNWKVTAEAFLEVYHFRHIHSHDGVSTLDNRGAAMGLYPNGHSRMITPYSQQRLKALGMKSWDDWFVPDQSPFPVVESLGAGEASMIASTSTAVSLFPNMIVPFGVVGFPINYFWPIDKSTTRLDWVYYAPKDWEGDEDDVDDALPDHWQSLRTHYNRIMEEDRLNMAPMQESLESPALTGIPINYQERRIWHFHEQIDRMIGASRVPDGLAVRPLLHDYLL